MIRLTKLADYGVVLLSYMASEPGRLYTTTGLARVTWVSVPTVSKVLKILARQGVLTSHRGANGGYALARDPRDISIAEVISAMEGPIAVTECVENSPGECAQEEVCGVRTNWQRINDAVRGALEQISLEEMAQPLTEPPASSGDDLVHLGSRAS